MHSMRAYKSYQNLAPNAHGSSLTSSSFVTSNWIFFKTLLCSSCRLDCHHITFGRSVSLFLRLFCCCCCCCCSRCAPFHLVLMCVRNNCMCKCPFSQQLIISLYLFISIYFILFFPFLYQCNQHRLHTHTLTQYAISLKNEREKGLTHRHVDKVLMTKLMLTHAFVEFIKGCCHMCRCAVRLLFVRATIHSWIHLDCVSHLLIYSHFLSFFFCLVSH